MIKDIEAIQSLHILPLTYRVMGMNKILFVFFMYLFNSGIVVANDNRFLGPYTAANHLPSYFSTDKIVSNQVKSGQGMFHALKGLGIDNSVALEMINVLRDEVEFSKLKVGNKLTGTFNLYNELIEFSFSHNPAQKHILVKGEITNKWTYSLEEEETFWVSKMLNGSLEKGGSLLSSLLEQGISQKVANDVISALMCKVNFRMDARLGDKFKALISERKFNGEVIETRVLYTAYSGQRTGEHETFLYQDDEAGSAYNAHYTEDGQALVRSGLRYPLSRIHVRSNFGMRRHPVTGKRTMHRGVDLRARSGSSVFSVARGKVILSTYNKYAGNKIGIKHNDGSSSYYFHLRKRKVKRGDYVKTHQVIGLVGATGRVTGAHLHFGFKRANGKWMNPLSKRMIATPKLSGLRLSNLTNQISSIRMDILDLELNKKGRYLLAHIPNLRKQKPLKLEELLNVYEFEE